MRESARKHKGMLSNLFAWGILLKSLRTDNPRRDVKVEGGERKLMVWSADLFHSMRDALGASDETEMMRCYMDLSPLLYQRSTDARIAERRHIGDQIIIVAPTKTCRSSGVEIEIPITPELRVVLDRVAQSRLTRRIDPAASGEVSSSRPLRPVCETLDACQARGLPRGSLR